MDQLLFSTTRICRLPKQAYVLYTSDKPILTSDGFPVRIVAYHRPSWASATWHSTSHAAPMFDRPQATHWLVIQNAWKKQDIKGDSKIISGKCFICTSFYITCLFIMASPHSQLTSMLIKIHLLRTNIASCQDNLGWWRSFSLQMLLLMVQKSSDHHLGCIKSWTVS